MFIGNVQNICNLIVAEEYNIGYIVFSVSILCSLKKNDNIFECCGKKKIEIH